jgi:hypothetical protein
MAEKYVVEAFDTLTGEAIFTSGSWEKMKMFMEQTGEIEITGDHSAQIISKDKRWAFTVYSDRKKFISCEDLFQLLENGVLV